MEGSWNSVSIILLSLSFLVFNSTFLGAYGLTLLNLSHSNFSGKIPVELLQLTKLVSLDLSSNSLSAEKSFLDNLFRNLTTLKELSLGSVDISSEIPENITNLSYLKSLYLDDCNLIGGFPSRVLLIPTIKSLSLSGNNKMEGPLPKFHGNNSLEVLDLSSTSFSVSVVSMDSQRISLQARSVC
ncbi:hypothetical protein ARALYDRAFT_892691 [Arabidopsis lyrata subsp. lyrata]|uniref:Leucine-rich repeat family protein n=1 Tax=Arabidopsis lyrata subsp. lyrata TaxID=81972 RepID=D7KP13_ARALL|nr:hypothetical protein ARALYDRAFT_892691 [Arabidopsis lyrata subsp. lyrata]